MIWDLRFVLKSKGVGQSSVLQHREEVVKSLESRNGSGHLYISKTLISDDRSHLSSPVPASHLASAEHN